MNDLIRSGIYTGMGAAVLARKKFEEFVEELIQNNDLTREEGQRVVMDLIHKAEDARNDLEAGLTSAVDEILHTLKLPARNEIEVFISEWVEKLSANPFSIPKTSRENNKPSTT